MRLVRLLLLQGSDAFLERVDPFGLDVIPDDYENQDRYDSH